jgi:putative lipoic acid-binding regulatory protein
VKRRVVLILDRNGCKPEIAYPCRWVYKVVGKDYELVRLAVLEVIQVRTCEISYSRSSSAGKYQSLSVEVEVESEEQRNSFYVALKEHPAVKIVL